jgi:hypothetical protein
MRLRPGGRALPRSQTPVWPLRGGRKAVPASLIFCCGELGVGWGALSGVVD